MEVKSHSAKIIKGDISRSKLSQSYRPYSNLIDDRGSQLGSQFTDKTSNPKRSRISFSGDEDQSESFPSVSGQQPASNAEPSQNNSSILHRVTNSVSGLFSHVSWSEWLKGSSTSTPANEMYEASYEDMDIAPGSPKHDCHLLNQLYPEEGIADLNNSTEVAGSSAHQGSGDKCDVPVKFNIPSFKDDQSFISSTPALSPYPQMRRANEEYLCDSIISKTSTSEFRREILPPQENCINLLKKSFPESHSEAYNGSINTFASGRKRLRDTIEEDETASDNSYQNVSKKRPLLSQIFTEETDVLAESAKKKRPRFSISTYGSPLYSKRVEEEEPSFSIFYPGKIMYGGAANHQRKRSRIIPRKICPRTPAINSTNVDDHSDGGLSYAAKRILDCIDKISTPLSDSKRAFQFNNSRDYSFNNTTFVADFHKHRPSLKPSEVHSPPVTKLLTPSKVKITKNFSSLFEMKTGNIAGRQKEAKEAHETNGRSEPVSRSKVSPPKSFTPSASVPSAVKEFSTTTYQSTLIKPFVSEKLATLKPIKNSVNLMAKTNERSERLKSTEFESISNKSEDKAQKVVNNEAKSDHTNQSSNTDNDIQYSFAKPGIMSDLLGEETIPECIFEFKFSQPITEAETSLKNDLQPLKFSFKKAIGSWECGTCLLQNKGENDKCAACLTSKPSKTSSQVKSRCTIDPFKREVGSWDCNSCLLRNKSEAENCIACSASRSESTALKPVSEGLENWGDSFKASKGSWDCEMCLLQNKESVSNCAACETPKPVSGKKNSVNNSIDTKVGSWGDAFKPSEESWTCETCKMQNTSNPSICLGCKTPKGKPLKNGVDHNKSKSFNYSFGTSSKENSFKDPQKENLKQDGLKDSENIWLCPECIMTNKSSDLKCISCKCSKPSFVSDSSNSIRTTSVSGFGPEFFKAKGEWECETCLVRNKSIAQKCASCATPKVGANHSTIVSEAMTGNFKFGVNANQSKGKSSGGFKFEMPNVSQEKISNTCNFETNTKPSDINNSSILKFGINTEPAKESSSTLKFGIDAKPVALESSANLTSTNLLSQPPEKKDSLLSQNLTEAKTTPLSSASASIFGNSISATASSTSQSISTTTASPVPSFSFKPSIANSEKKDEKPAASSEETKTKPMFQFGATSLPNTQKSETKLEFPKITNNTSTQSDSFSQLPKVNPTTFSFFGNNAAPAPAPRLTFGIPQETKAPFANEANASNKVFAFGQTETKSSNTGFNFGNADANKPTTGSFNFGNMDTKPSTSFNFGNVDTNKPSTGFNFGNVETNKPSTALFNFGSGATSTPVFNFGRQATTTFSAPPIKPAEAATPLVLNIPEHTNPFSALGASSSEPQKRVIRKGCRRLK